MFQSSCGSRRIVGGGGGGGGHIRNFPKSKKVQRAACGKGIYVRSVFPLICSGLSKLLGDK